MRGEKTAPDSFSRDRLSIARIRVASSTGIDEAYAHAARVSSRALRVRRVGIWLFEDERRKLRCVHLHDADPGATTFPNIDLLYAKDFPTYVAALEENRWVTADDALNDPATRELAAGYLIPLGITSMLDAPILRDGALFGIVCHEHVGPARVWTPEERGFAGSVADVVALIYEQGSRHAAEEALRAREDAERQSERLEALGRLSASVAHDVNNLLAAIDGLVTVAERSTLDEKSRGALAQVHDVTTRGAALMKRLLLFGRGQPALEANVDLVSVVRALVVVLETLVRGRCELVMALEMQSATVLADPSQLEQILLNLALNARDAMPDGGELRVSVTEELEDGQRMVALTVADDGIGMNEETRARVFEPFFTTKSNDGGTGLGLSTVYGLVKQLGGRVEVSTQLNRGSTFRVLLPLR